MHDIEIMQKSIMIKELVTLAGDSLKQQAPETGHTSHLLASYVTSTSCPRDLYQHS